jgi:2-oxoglutarate ferredoxin oxidoreductase subunit alpha
MLSFLQTVPDRTDLLIRIAGEGGQGILTAGEILSRAIARSGLHILADATFSSDIKGGDALFQLRISSSPILSQGDRLDILVALSENGYRSHEATLAPGCMVICDDEMILRKPDGVIFYPIPMARISSAMGSPVSKNMVALGVMTRLLSLPADPLRQVIGQALAAKGASVVQTNLKAFDEGISYGKDHLVKQDPYLLPVGTGEDNRLLLNGNEAIGLGALMAGCRLYAYCPITPSTTIGDWLSHHLPGVGGKAIMTEDAIESAALAIGASYAGAKAMTGTSGPGLDLMQELIGFAGMAELPLVIVDVQRAGPSQGLATKHEQSDLFSAAIGGHGDSPRIVVAAADVNDCIGLTVDAFNLAERYQAPVIVLSDASLSRRRQTVPRPDLSQVGRVGRALHHASGSRYLRYRLTADGISPMSVPGQSGGEYTATGVEHTESGSPTEIPRDHEAMTEKRFRKLSAVEEDFSPVEREGAARAEVGFISWGMTQGAVREAMQRFRQIGLPAAALYPKLLWPLPVKALEAFAASVNKVIVVEANQQGQLAALIRAQTKIHPGLIHLCTGVPISPWEIFGRESF